MKIIKGHVVLFSGFLQSQRRANGMNELWEKLWANIRWDGDYYLWPVQNWKADVEGIAEQIQRSNAKTAMLIGFSWGGATSLRLCGALAARGISVPDLVLTDPVRRPGAFAGLVPGLRELLVFKQPENVGRAKVFYQRTSWPFGFQMLQTKPVETHGIVVHNSLVSGVRHAEMDSAFAFQSAALIRVAHYVRGDYCHVETT